MARGGAVRGRMAGLGLEVGRFRQASRGGLSVACEMLAGARSRGMSSEGELWDLLEAGWGPLGDFVRSTWVFRGETSPEGPRRPNISREAAEEA